MIPSISAANVILPPHILITSLIASFSIRSRLYLSFSETVLEDRGRVTEIIPELSMVPVDEDGRHVRWHVPVRAHCPASGKVAASFVLLWKFPEVLSYTSSDSVAGRNQPRGTSHFHVHAEAGIRISIVLMRYNKS